MAHSLTNAEISDMLFADIPEVGDPSDASDDDDDDDDGIDKVQPTPLADPNNFDEVFDETLRGQNQDITDKQNPEIEESRASEPDENCSMMLDTNSQSNRRRRPKETDYEPDRKWRKRELNTCVPPYNHPEGVNQDKFAQCETPTDIFLTLIGEDLIHHITYQSNLYSMQKSKTLNLKEHEFLCVLGINFMMGYHSVPATEHYWSTADDLNVPPISGAMPRSRFQEILANLHVNDNKAMSSTCKDKLYKLRPLIDGLNKQFQSSYNGTREVSIDESIIKFKGRSSIKQYNPMKPVKRGYKLWCSCDQKGYTLEFRVYQGKDEELEGEFTGYGLGERVVLQLTKPFWGKQRIVFFDNFFSSLRLIERLKMEKTLACGTIRSTRIGGPKNMAEDKTLKRGDSDFRFSSSDIGYFKWMDNRVVNFVSNFHGSEETSVLRTSKDGSRKDVRCLTVVSSYNKYMGGVDHADRLRSLYNADRKSKKWWHRLFWGFFDIALVNAFVIYCSMFGKSDMLTFKRALARGLISQRAPPNKRGRPLTSPQPVSSSSKRRKSGFSVPKDVRHGNRGIHWVTFDTLRGRCEVCSSKKIQSRPHSKCSHCKVFLCLNEKKNCFAEYHGVDA